MPDTPDLRKSFLRHIPCRIAMWLGIALSCGVLEGSPSREINRIAEIRKLSCEESLRAIPVKFSGVVLWTGMGAVVVHDGETSIWVDVNRGLKKNLPPIDRNLLEPGSLLEIEGTTDPGGYAPVVIPSLIRHTGTRPLITPSRVPVDEMLSGSADCMDVEVEGVVQEFIPSWQEQGTAMMSMITDGHSCRIFVVHASGLDETKVVDSRIRVRGIFAPDHNVRAEAIGMKLLVNTADDIRILAPPPSDPFLSPRVPLNRLAPYTPEARPWHRKVTAGTITYAEPGKFFFLHDADTSVRINSSERNVKPGMRVDVSGFVESFDSIAAMKNALVRPLGFAPPPPPLAVTSGNLLDSARFTGRNSASTDLACRMVRLRGRIQRVEWNKSGTVRNLRIEADDWVFPAYLPDNQHQTETQIRSWVTGATVELTGICELKYGGSTDLKPSLAPVAFHLLMPDPSSVKVLQVPPWWNLERMRIAFASVGLVVLLLLAWTWTLRRQVKRQTRMIGEKIASVAVHEERSRIARDLHDAIEQQLTGVSLHLYGAKSAIESDPKSAAGALDTARRMLKHTQKETRNSIRNLRSPLLENRSLAAALQVLAEQSTPPNGARIVVDAPHPPAGLLPDTEYQLLRLAQEGLGNAIKHANASLILIRIDTTADQIILSVTDDGCGFCPLPANASSPSHFGMLGMQERAARIGAACEVRSAPGQGTTVSISLPLKTHEPIQNTHPPR